jgi:probable AcnD-accessory protein PrpF
VTQLRIPAVYMRGGTSKGVFLRPEDLPADAAARDRILLRIIGSPDPYGKQIDGMGAATSSTSKVVLVSKSQRPDCDVDYLFGQVRIDAPLIDWSGNCGNLTTAVGPYAISEGILDAPRDGVARVKIWQANIGKRIIAHVPMRGGQVVEEGDFELDGVTFPAAEVRLEFMDPGEGGEMFPTGSVIDFLEIENRKIETTLINAGNPTVFVAAASLGLKGTEMQDDVNGNPALLARAEAIRTLASVRMKLAKTLMEAAARGHTPKIAFIAPPAEYTASDGKRVTADSIDLLARIISMGKLHHAMTGTGGVAIAAAAAIPGTLVQKTMRAPAGGRIRFGHPSGTLGVGAEARAEGGQWIVGKALMSRSARRLMEGWVRVPHD